MNYTRFNLSSVLRPVRFFLAGLICAFLFMSYALPAYSATSKPTEGEANLTQIERKAQEATLDNPYTMRKEVEEQNPGLNAIQGTADADKMKRPDNSQNAESVEGKIKDALENITGKK